MNTVMTKEVKLGSDIYTLEVSEGEFKTKYYSVLINGTLNKTYTRFPQELKEFFNI